MWEAIEARIAENDVEAPVARRRILLASIQQRGLQPNGGDTKKMVGLTLGGDKTLVWELSDQARNLFVSVKWRQGLQISGLAFDERPFIHGIKDGKRHSGLNRAWSFPGMDCLCVRIDSPNELDRLLAVLGREATDSNAGFMRLDVEAAMDAWDRHRDDGEQHDIFGRFGEPRDYWVRSTRERANRVYPTKPLVGFILKKAELNGGWGQKADAAAQLHNAGFVIVDQDDKPISPPERYDHLMDGADRIRLCALNYFIEPAREVAASEVSIGAGELAGAMGLRDAFPNICQALGGEKFQQMAQVPAPTHTEPNPSSSTIFTYKLGSQAEADTVTEVSSMSVPSATNLILYGPPGTGKTYRTAWEAVRLCLGAQTAVALEGDEKRDALMAEYRRLVNEGRIEFVTFHQSMSYEEFVEGLRPQTGDTGAQTGFRLQVEPGIFVRTTQRALVGRAADKAITLDGRTVFKMSIGNSTRASSAALFEDAIAQGYAIFGFEDLDWSDERYEDRREIARAMRENGARNPAADDATPAVQMTDIFRNQLSIGDILVVSKGNNLVRAIGEVTGEYEFHPRGVAGYSHRRAVVWHWSDPDGIPVKEIFARQFVQRTIYPLPFSDLNRSAIEAYLNNTRSDVDRQDFVLIIDEINRANISKVFGELITLLEPDKRLGMLNEIRLVLPYSKQLFGVPSNLHIIGTMNTADRSIALLDTALRRRFAFRELTPNPLALSKNIGGIDLQKLLTTINDRIEYLFDREHQIGHAYFTGCRTRDDVQAVMRFKVIPLLAEYFYEDWSKVAAVLGDTRQGQPRFLIREDIRPPEGMESDAFDGPKQRWRVKPEKDIHGNTVGFDLSEFEA